MTNGAVPVAEEEALVATIEALLLNVGTINVEGEGWTTAETKDVIQMIDVVHGDEDFGDI